MGLLLKRAETFRYVADYGGEPVELRDARDIVEQVETFVATIRSVCMPDFNNDSLR